MNKPILLTDKQRKEIEQLNELLGCLKASRWMFQQMFLASEKTTEIDPKINNKIREVRTAMNDLDMLLQTQKQLVITPNSIMSLVDDPCSVRR